jgi:hypothetical protein
MMYDSESMEKVGKGGVWVIGMKNFGETKFWKMRIIFHEMQYGDGIGHGFWGIVKASSRLFYRILRKRW